MPSVRLFEICKLLAFLDDLSGSRCWISAPSSSSSLARRRPRRSPHAVILAFSSLTCFYVTLSFSGNFFWQDLVAQGMGNGSEMGWLVVLEGWYSGELPPFISADFLLSCRFSLSTGSATLFAPLARPGQPPTSPMPFHRTRQLSAKQKVQSHPSFFYLLPTRKPQCSHYSKTPKPP